MHGAVSMGALLYVELKWCLDVDVKCYTVFLYKNDKWTELVKIYNSDICEIKVQVQSRNKQYMFMVSYEYDLSNRNKSQVLYARTDGRHTYIYPYSNIHIRDVIKNLFGVQLLWDRDNQITKYRIFKKIDEGPWTIIGDTSDDCFYDESYNDQYNCSYTVRGLDENTNDYLTDYDLEGKKIVSNKQIELLPITIKSIVPLTNGLRITWNKIDANLDICIFKLDAYEKWEKIATLKGDVCEYVDFDVKSGTRYTYTLVYDNISLNKLSDMKNNYANSIFCSQPELCYAKIRNMVVSIAWTKVDGAEEYRIFGKNDYEWERVATVSKDYCEYHYEVGNNKIYKYYTVRCVNNNKYSSSFDAKGVSIRVLKGDQL